MLFIITWVSLAAVLRRINVPYELRKNGHRFNLRLFRNYSKLFAKTQLEMERLAETSNAKLQQRYRDGGIQYVEVCSVQFETGQKSRLQRHRIAKQRERIEDLDDDGCNCLEMPEVDDILLREVKDRFISAYSKYLRLILKSKLNSRNFVTAINVWAIAVICYSGSILKWTRADID